MSAKPVAIVMGSQSDWSVMRRAAETLEALGVGFDARIVSAHRTPDRLVAFAKGARAEGFKVVIAGAGGAAHLPGMTAAFTSLPVFGVPVPTQAFSGPGQPALDRPDAGRRAGRHARDWRGRRRQRRAAGLRRAGAVGRGACANGSTPGGRAARPRSPSVPPRGTSVTLSPGATIGILGVGPARPDAGDRRAEGGLAHATSTRPSLRRRPTTPPRRRRSPRSTTRRR